MLQLKLKLKLNSMNTDGAKKTQFHTDKSLLTFHGPDIKADIQDKINKYKDESSKDNAVSENLKTKSDKREKFKKRELICGCHDIDKSVLRMDSQKDESICLKDINYHNSKENDNFIKHKTCAHCECTDSDVEDDSKQILMQLSKIIRLLEKRDDT